MKRRTKGVLIISILGIVGVFTSFAVSFGYGFMSWLEGYTGQCSTMRLPFMVQKISAEVGLVAVVGMFYVYSEFFEIRKNFLKYSFIPLIINLAFVVYEVAKYPLLFKASNALNDGGTDTGVFYNPLIYLSLILSSLMILLVYRNGGGLSNKLFSKTAYISVSLLMIVQLIFLLKTEFIPCQY